MSPTQDRPFFPRINHRRAFAALGWTACAAAGLTIMPPSAGSADSPPRGADQPRAQVAAHPRESTSHRLAVGVDQTSGADQTAIDRAKALMAACQVRYDALRDYTCTFYKREAIDGKLSDYHVMDFKARTKPLSFYIKCSTPRKGREAIWIKGKHDGKVVAHDSGVIKVLAGTMYLDPKGNIAMEDNRHPITEAGLGNMIETIRRSWEVELKPGLTQVRIQEGHKVGDRPCTMIETTHLKHDSSFVFHRLRLFIDDQLGLPVRLEGFDWPKGPHAAPELVEEYTFDRLKVNVGLSDRDFDPANPSYAYGRF